MKKSDQQLNAILDHDINVAIASSLLPTSPAPEVANRIKQKLMSSIQAGAGHHQFIFANQGEWKTIATGVEVKLLHKSETGKSLLIKMAADSSLPHHEHEQDEESFVVEGQVWLDGILCYPGDYHHATAGGYHRDIHTKTGCILLVRF